MTESEIKLRAYEEVRAELAAKALDAGEETGGCETCAGFDMTGWSMDTVNEVIDKLRKREETKPSISIPNDRMRQPIHWATLLATAPDDVIISLWAEMPNTLNQILDRLNGPFPKRR